MLDLKAELVIQLQVQCTSNLEVGNGPDGLLKVIPIIGGTFHGKLSGKVISGGADWNTSKAHNIAHVYAKYLLQTENGEYIAVENTGMIQNEENRTIKTVPRFVAAQDGQYAWLNTGVYVGALEGGQEPNTVEIKLYQLM